MATEEGPGDPIRIKELVDVLSTYPSKIFTVGELFFLFRCPATHGDQIRLEHMLYNASREQF